LTVGNSNTTLMKKTHVQAMALMGFCQRPSVYGPGRKGSEPA
jgi:hypothetical protein